jgi:hypothetical protein
LGNFSSLANYLKLLEFAAARASPTYLAGSAGKRSEKAVVNISSATLQNLGLKHAMQAAWTICSSNAKPMVPSASTPLR